MPAALNHAVAPVERDMTPRAGSPVVSMILCPGESVMSAEAVMVIGRTRAAIRPQLRNGFRATFIGLWADRGGSAGFCFLVFV